MNAIIKFLEKFILPIATKIGTQKHLVAVRDAFIGTTPITMAGSLVVLLNAFLRDFPRSFGWTGFVELMTPIIGVNGVVWGGTLTILAVVFAASLGYNLARVYEIDPLACALVSMAALFMGLPQSDSAGEWGFFQFGIHLDGNGLFTALIFGLISVIIFAKLIQKKIVIKMPESVPPAVSKAFTAIIPAFGSLYICGIIYYVFQKITGQALINWITNTIQAPLMNLTQGYGAVLIMVILIHLLWFFGLHGNNIMGPALSMLYGNPMNLNMNAYQMGTEIPYQWVSGSFNAFVWPGGAGATLILIVAIILLSKREDLKAISKISLAPGIFNINEPIMFGLPVVLNPIFMIPFTLAPIATVTISYFATIAGLVNPVVVSTVWVMPPIINGFLATGGDWRSIILSLVNIAVAFAIWAPFVIAANNLQPTE